ncbi:MAG: hypothetical protein V3R77_03475 [Candidatus Binatia bacterium]
MQRARVKACSRGERRRERVDGTRFDGGEGLRVVRWERERRCGGAMMQTLALMRRQMFGRMRERLA